jgi:hypothetical protein
VNVTLSVSVQGEVTEESNTNVVIHIGDDGSEERILLATTPIFYATIHWNVLAEADSGTVLDLYHTSAQGMLNSFKWVHDGYTYVVRFDGSMERTGQRADRYAIPARLKLLGKV